MKSKILFAQWEKVEKKIQNDAFFNFLPIMLSIKTGWQIRLFCREQYFRDKIYIFSILVTLSIWTDTPMQTV